MNNLFNKTKEITIEEFVSMWNKGGTCSIGNQFSNADKSDYLMVVDTEAKDIKAQKERELEEFHSSIPTYSLGGVGRHPVNAKDALRLHQMRAEMQCINDVVTNIVETFDAGWVTSGLRATDSHTKITKIEQLPEKWEECYLIYESYPVFKRVLVARNNMDGTVQLFRA